MCQCVKKRFRTKNAFYPMKITDKVFTLPVDQSNLALYADSPKESYPVLEHGKILLLPKLHFSLNGAERVLLSEDIISKGRKNISCYQGAVRGAERHTDLVAGMMQRFLAYAQTLVLNLLPNYTKDGVVGRTSYRPVSVVGRNTSRRKDDTLLHVDAFPSTPVHGNRILRVFANLNPEGAPRVWHVGESFEQIVTRFLPKAKRYRPFVATLLNIAGVTKTKRSAYDHYMCQLHDLMKQDARYQKESEHLKVEFPAPSTWIVFTDQASHAALEGQYALEQTFYVPCSALNQPSASPLSILATALSLSPAELVALH